MKAASSRYRHATTRARRPAERPITGGVSSSALSVTAVDSPGDAIGSRAQASLLPSGARGYVPWHEALEHPRGEIDAFVPVLLDHIALRTSRGLGRWFR